MNSKLKKVLKFCFYPLMLLRNQWWKYLGARNPEKLARRIYYWKFFKKLNLEDPQDLNEKIQWLKFRTDTTQWSILADKYKVREYVMSKGLENILTRLYGRWDNADEVDFDKLPNSFVLKATHGAGAVILVKDKKKLDIEKTRYQLNSWLKMKIGLTTAEPHYLKQKPCIIAEEYLEDKKMEKYSSSIIDYKFWCLDGKPYICLVCFDRVIGKEKKVCIYDLNWNLRMDLIGKSHSHDIVDGIPKPKNLDLMLEVCRKLSKEHPQVRVDLYEINGMVYFGELTFTAMGGYMDSYTPECLLEMGKRVTLPR